MTDAAPPRGTLGTIRNASVLLDLLSEGAAFHQLTDLAERSGLSLPTVHRLLRSLVVAGLVHQDPASSRYSLGPELVRLSERYLERLPLLHILAPYLVDLRNRTALTVLVAILVRDTVVYVDRVDGTDVGGLLRRTARSFPATNTAAGRVLLGRAGPQAWDRLDLADRAGVDLDEVSRWEKADYVSAPVEGMAGHTEVAVPILKEDGYAAAALVGMGGPPAFDCDRLVDELVPQLQQTAAVVSRVISSG